VRLKMVRSTILDWSYERFRSIQHLYLRCAESIPKRYHPFAIAGLVVILMLCSYAAWRLIEPKTVVNNGPAPIPVTVAQVTSTDFPVYLNSLGTVQPFDTVTLHSRVDGEVIKTAFEQGQMVKEGDLLVQIDPRPYQAALDQALAKKAQDEANLKNTQIILGRYSTLVGQAIVTREQFDTQQATVDQLSAQVKGDQAAIDNAQTQLSYTTIRSPLTGKAGFRLIDPGNIVHAADTLGIVTIVKLQPIAVVFTAPEESVGQINKALAAGTVPVDALSSDGTKALAGGKLALVNNQVDQASGTIGMKATFENKDNALWPGLSVSTRLRVDVLKQVVVVPNNAIQHGPNGLYAFVIGDSNKVEMRDIKIGDEGASSSVALEGLSAGDKVVIAGQYRLQEGSVVQPRAADASASSGKEAINTPSEAH
jgi:membrane fusion protein, multidrug efflux system